MIDAFRAVFLIGLEHLDMSDPRVVEALPYYMAEEGSPFRAGWHL